MQHEIVHTHTEEEVKEENMDVVMPTWHKNIACTCIQLLHL